MGSTSASATSWAPSPPRPERAPRRRLAASACAAALALCAATEARAACRVAPWSHLDRTLPELFGPRPLLLTTLAAAAPPAFALSPADHELRVAAMTTLGGRYGLEPVSVAAPFVVGGTALVGYAVSALTDSCELARVYAAMLQALAVSGLAVSGLKVATGRAWPTGGADPSAPDQLQHAERARDFQPFGRFGAWPSGHTATMFAAAAALRASTRGAWYGWLGYPFAFGVGAGMLLGDHHWASDIVSGALLGEAIGGAVGAAFSGDPGGGAPWAYPVPGGLVLGYGGPF